MSHIKIKNQKSKIKNSRGISLLFVVLITSFILAIGLGISALLIQEMRMMSEIGYSVTAFYAADTGIERVMEAVYKGYDFYEFSEESYGVCVGGTCDFGNCVSALTITFNDETYCGLSSVCSEDSECICPVDKCKNNIYYDYPETGQCVGNECQCQPEEITANCGDSINCSSGEDCPCPADFCVGLEPAACQEDSCCKTGFEETLENDASYTTYIHYVPAHDSIPEKNIVKSIGSYRKVKRAIEIKY